MTKEEAILFFQSLTRRKPFWAQTKEGFIQQCEFEKIDLDNDTSIATFGVYAYPSIQKNQIVRVNLEAWDSAGFPYCDFALSVLDLTVTAESFVGPSSSLNFKSSVLAASLVNLDAIADGVKETKTLTSTSNGILAVDGITPSVDDRVLIRAQSNPIDNGIYTVVETGDAGSPWVLKRSDDANSDAEVVGGLFIIVTDGIQYNDSAWLLSNLNGEANVDGEDLVFDKFPLSDIYISGDGININIPTGEINVDATVLRDTDIDDSTESLTTLWSSSKIKSLLDGDLSPTPKTEVITITPLMDTQKFFELSETPYSLSDISITVHLGATQLNSKYISNDASLVPNFSPDAIFPNRIYFKDDNGLNGNEVHTGIDGFFSGVTLIVSYSYLEVV